MIHIHDSSSYNKNIYEGKNDFNNDNEIIILIMKIIIKL